MKLSRRERTIGIATGAVIGLFVLDSFLITPWLTTREDLASRLEERREEMTRVEQTFSNLRRAKRRWAELAGATLREDASAAEGQLLNSLGSWAEDAGLSVSAVRPDRSGGTNGFGRVAIRASGTGDLADVIRFLWEVETATIPVRLEELQIATRTPGVDDLTLQFTVATIYLQPPEEGATP